MTDRTNQPTGERTQVDKTSAGEWYWATYAANGEEVARSSESYEHRNHAIDQAATEYPDRHLFAVSLDGEGYDDLGVPSA
jgi:hypothetical protein